MVRLPPTLGLSSLPSRDDLDTELLIRGNRASAQEDRRLAARARESTADIEGLLQRVRREATAPPTNRQYAKGSNRWEGEHPNDGNGYDSTYRGSPDNLGGPDGQGGPEREPPPDAVMPAEVDLPQYDEQAARLAERQAAMRAHLFGQTETPDRVAEASRLADELGVNRAEVEADPEAARLRRIIEKTDAYIETAPKLRTWLDDPENLAVAHDDESLPFWESAGKLLEQSGQVITQSWPKRLEASAAGLIQYMMEQPVGQSQPGDLTFSFSKQGVDVSLDMEGGRGGIAASDFIEFRDKDGNNALMSWAGAASKRADASMPQAGNVLSDAYLSALDSAGAMMPGLVASVIARNPAPGLAMMGGQTQGQSYAKAREAGLDPTAARRFADFDARVEMLTEAIPGMFLIDDIVKKTPIGKAILRNLASELPGELVAEELQSLNDWTTLNPDKPVSKYFAERPEAMLKTALSTAMLSGGMTTIAKGVDIAADAMNEQRQIEGARQRQRMFEALGASAKASDLKRRLPKKYREFVEQATKDGPLETVSIPADQFDAYFQSKQIDPREWAAALEVPTEVYEEALLRGDDITIPMGIFAEKIAGGEHDAGLVPHMRLRPNDFTAFEAEQKAGEFEAVFGEELKRFQDAQEMSADLAESETRVLEAVTESLKATGVYEKRAVVPANAAVMAAMVTTLGKRTGEDPMAIWETYGPQVRGMVGSEMTGLELSQRAMADLIRPVGFKTGWAVGEGGAERRVFEPRDVVLAYNDGDSLLDIVSDFNMEGQDNAQGLLKVLAYNVRQAVRTAMEQGQAADLAKAWNVTPDELEAFSRPRETSKSNTISDETLRLIELAAQGLKNKEIAERLGKTTDQVKALKSQRKGLIEARRAEVAAKRAGQQQAADALNQEQRGYFVRKAGETRSVIGLFEKRDISTFMHEASHWYLDLLVQMGQGENPHPFVMEQLAAVAKWKGLDALPPIWSDKPFFSKARNREIPAGGITEEWLEIQESFAETFEAYLREGKAPSRDLRDVFASFRQWLLSLYKSIRNIGSRVDLTPEIKGVFDRMLATDEAMAEASAGIEADAEALAKAMFDKGAIKTEAELERIKKRLATEREQATAEMSADLIRRFMATQKAKYLEDRRKVRNEAIIAVDQRPEQRALAILSGKGWMGDVVVAKELGDDYYEQAQRLGYTGTDIGEAVEWVEAHAKGLPMDEASRMERARKMGFDVDTPLYHGTSKDFEAFRPSDDGVLGPGVYLTEDSYEANKYARGYKREAAERASILPVFVRGRLADINEHSQALDAAKGDFKRAAEILTEKGYSGIAAGGHVVIFDPKNIRSRFAAFDSAKSDSANLLAQSGPDDGQSLAQSGDRPELVPEPVAEENVDGSDVERQAFVKLLPFADRWGDTRDDEAARHRVRDFLTPYWIGDKLKRMPLAEVEVLANDLWEIAANTYMWEPDAQTKMAPNFFGAEQPMTIMEYERRYEFARTAGPVFERHIEELKERHEAATGDKLEYSGRYAEGRYTAFRILYEVRILAAQLADRRGGQRMLAGLPKEAPRSSIRSDPSQKQLTGFYSATAAAVKEMPDRYWQMGGTAVYNWLKKQPAVKVEELDDLGLQEFLTDKGRPIQRTREEILQYIAESEVRLKRNFAMFDPESPTGDYEYGGTRAFDGPRIPGRGVYFEDRLSFPRRTPTGEPYAPGMFESPHWGDTKSPNAWGSIRGSIREVEGIGRVVIGEEAQSDFFQGAAERRPLVSAKQYLEWKQQRTQFKEERYIMDRVSQLHGIRVDGRFIFPSLELTAEQAEQVKQDLRTKIKGQPQAAELMKAALVSLEDHPNFYEAGAYKRYVRTESSFTPESPFKKSWESVLIKALILRAVQQGANAVAISTSETTGRIQNNQKAAPFYDNAFKPRLQKIARQITGDDAATVELVKLPAKRGTKPYSVWMIRLTPDTVASIRERGLPLYQTRDSTAPGWGPIPPPPSLPPMRLDLQAVREMHGDDALKRLPPEVVQFSATATDVDQLVNVARDVAASKRGPKPKTMWQFFARRRHIGEGMGKVAYVGIRDPGGEILAMIGEKKAYPGLLAERENDTKTVRSYSVHDAAIAAWEAGYTPGDAPLDDNAFLDLLRQDVDGSQPVYREEDQDRVAALAAADRWASWFDETMSVNVNERNTELLRRQIAASIDPASENKLAPDQAAEILNAALKSPAFRTGEDLLNALSLARGREKAITEETDRRMREKHGPDPFNDGTIMEMARHYANGEMAQRRGEIELDALSRAAGQPAASRLAKQLAKRQLQAMTVKQVQGYRTFLANERRWMKAAIAATKKGELREAALHRQRALVNQQLYYEGEKLAERLEKTRQHMVDYGHRAKQISLRKAGADYAEQMQALLEEYEFVKRGPKALEQRQSLAAWFAQKQADLDPLVDTATMTVEEKIIREEEALERSRALQDMQAEARQKNYINLTVEELESVRTQADAIWTMAKLKDKILTEQQRVSLKLAAADLAASIEANQPNPLPKAPLESDTPDQKQKRSLAGYLEGHRTLQSLAREFDGGKDGGAFWRFIVKPLNAAFARLSTMRGQASKDISRLFSLYSEKEIRGLDRGKQYIAAIDNVLTKQGRIAVALNWGTEKGRARVMDSEGWSEAQVQAILSTLDQRDWQFIQNVWKYLDSFWADSNATHIAVHGVPMTKEPGIEVATRFGVIQGGYYPIKFDSARSAKSDQRGLEADAKGMAGRVGARVTRGSTISRVEGKVTIPLRLSVFDVITQHVDEVMTSIATDRAMLDVGRMIMRPEVQKAVIERHGMVKYRAIVSTLREAKNGQEVARETWEKAVIHLRNGQTIVGLGLNLVTAALQPLGLTNSIVRVGGYWMARGIARAGRTAIGRENAVKFIVARSEMMQNREKSQTRELADLRNKLKRRTMPQWVEDSYFFFITKTQFLAVDVPTWYGQFEKSMAAGASEADAAAHADQAVIDAQGTGEVYGLAGVQRGSPLWRLFTNFMSYMITTYNLSAQRIANARIRGPLSAMSLGIDMLLLWSVPVAGSMVLRAILTGGGEDDEDEDLWLTYSKEQIRFLMGPFAIVNQLAGALGGYGYRGPQGLQSIAEGSAAAGAVTRATEATIQGEEADWLAVLRPANKAAGAIFHYPAGQVDRTVRGLNQLYTGETDDLSVILFGPKKAA